MAQSPQQVNCRRAIFFVISGITLLNAIFAPGGAMKLSLAAKFNIVFLTISGIGFAAASTVTNYLLQENAREETLQNARMLMQAALSARTYTTGQIVPL